ncbi:chitooligosaccharide deacetylase [Paenibacillus macquariensis subsp. defensor]|nr:chitooligosaccharide deacetylase [Paenibacillus macquariensis subsp. defensor]
MLNKIALCFMFSLILGGIPQAQTEIQGTSIPTLSKLCVASDPILHKQQSKQHAKEVNSTHRNQQKNKRLTLSQLYRKFPETIVTKGPRSKKIALTFDDVPDQRFTPAVLNVLSKYHVKATFFVVGKRAEDYPGLVARMKREGHAIGNHSYDHPLFTKIPLSQFQKQIVTTDTIIHNIVGYNPKIMRPPYGDITEEQLKWAKKQGYKIVNWNVDSLDWKGLRKNEVKRNILSSVGRGSIILQHAGGGVGSDLTGTIQALPEVIQNLRKKGYIFVTVPELLRIPVNK